MDLVDTHCHIQSIGQKTGEKITRQLWSKASDLTIDKVVKNARAHDVNRLIIVGCTLEDSKLAVDCALGLDNAYASVGIHPHEAQNYRNNQAKLDDFEKLLTAERVVAIGECGLDYYYDHSPRQAQQQILRWQLSLAKKYDLPLIFHVRQAFKDFWPIFSEYSSKDQPLSGVLHSYTDSLDNLKIALEHGLFIGVNGIATFVKNPDQLALYRQIPLTNLVLETDSPFLTPHPFRGSINEPKNVRQVAQYLAELRGEGLNQLAKLTTANAKQLFSIS